VRRAGHRGALEKKIMNSKPSSNETSEQAQSCALENSFTSQLTYRQIIDRIEISGIALRAIRDAAWLSYCSWAGWETPLSYRFPGAQNREMAGEFEIIAWCEERMLDWTPEHQFNACLI